GTPFQHSVWQKLLDIPQGHVTSYKGLADELNSAPRATGGAVGANPVSLLVPCHRVLAADKRLNGYRWGLEVKARILAAEGAIFRQA
ncbi:MAG: methylated-DNA--[protein]-cysteine S-methyltransferase, partial [Pseudomonadota bacterium]|nr:methylated-DNA--[protein]-cysteine S-methyltransferase [Pseudomonadota bacterium]